MAYFTIKNKIIFVLNKIIFFVVKIKKIKYKMRQKEKLKIFNFAIIIGKLSPSRNSRSSCV